MRDSRLKFATRREVADALGLPVRTLDTWATQDKGPRYVRVGKHTRYRWSDVEAWLDQQPHGGEVRA